MSDIERPLGSADNTRERILRTAISHFARFGFGGATVRKILAEAGVNQALAHYHFGSKNALFVACVRSKLDVVLERRTQLLSQWDQCDKGNFSTYERLCNLMLSYVEPHFEAAFCGEYGEEYSRLMQHVWANPGDYSDPVRIPTFDIRRQYVARAHKLLPESTRQQIERLFDALVAVMLAESIRHDSKHTTDSKSERELPVRERALFCSRLIAVSAVQCTDLFSSSPSTAC